MTMPAIDIEICIGCTEPQALQADCTAALDGGAASIELCRDMALQGLTPTAADLRIARRCFPRAGLFPMIRPRAGDFDYSAAEVAVMCEQVAIAAGEGADGVVFGVVRDGKPPAGALEKLFAAARARDLRTTFHRAFDALDDQFAGLESLIALGTDRIMTSGTPWGSGASAADGATRLAQLIELAGQRVEIVLGGGISAVMLPVLLHALPLSQGRVSAHAYGAVLDGGAVDARKVTALVQAATVPA
jgi:copper homeostasis protein